MNQPCDLKASQFDSPGCAVLYLKLHRFDKCTQYTIELRYGNASHEGRQAMVFSDCPPSEFAARAFEKIWESVTDEALRMGVVLCRDTFHRELFATGHGQLEAMTIELPVLQETMPEVPVRRKTETQLCACGHHTIARGEDSYQAHTLWVEEEADVEQDGSALSDVPGPPTKKPLVLGVDNWGDEFELSPEELRAYREAVRK